MNDICSLQSQLDRVLGFFPRVETRINGLFGVNALILVISALNLSAQDLRFWFVSSLVGWILASLLASYIFLFRANFPNTGRDEGSLIYFAEIQRRSEASYVNELLTCSEDTYRNDLARQIWRNSKIVCYKYEEVKRAIVATTISLVPFVIFLVVTATIHERIPFLRG